MDHVTLKLSSEEKRIILLWYDYFRSDSQHYGDGLAMFPQEQIVLRKLEQADKGPVTFSLYDIETIKSWMDKSVKSKYGTDVYLTGEEGMVYDKISQLYKVCFPDQGHEVRYDNTVKKYSLDPDWKRPEPDRPRQDDAVDYAVGPSEKERQCERAVEKSRQIKMAREDQKNRSFEEKLKGVSRFKGDLKNLEDKFKDFQRGKKKK